MWYFWIKNSVNSFNSPIPVIIIDVKDYERLNIFYVCDFKDIVLFYDFWITFLNRFQ